METCENCGALNGEDKGAFTLCPPCQDALIQGHLNDLTVQDALMAAN